MLYRDAAEALPTWRFRFEDEAWQPVVVPHSWNAYDAVGLGDGWYRRGTGFYTTELATPAGRRTFVRFGAASQRAVVRWNGREIGQHAGGYLPFTVELPPNEAGVLNVEVDNQPDPDLIPSERSDFFLYGGLTRPVSCYTTGPLRIEQVQVDPQVRDGQGMLALRLHVDGTVSDPSARYEVRIEMPDDTPIFTTTGALTAAETHITVPPLANPPLWSPNAPQRCRVHVTLWYDGRPSDRGSLRFGWRTVDFPAGGPFFLNGERLLLRGTHRHEDWAGSASAVSETDTRAEFLRIKEAGFNFVRLGHYPQASHVLDLCDELGLIVWDELPWCRGGVGGERFKQTARGMLRAMIAEHRHHPSIIFWGLGNELDWESDHPETGDDDVLAFLQELHDLSHALDSTRLTALRRYERGATVVDVYSPSIWSGWYRGRYEDYALALNAAQAQYPRLLHMEWGGDSHVGRYNDGPHLPHELRQESDHAEQDGLAYSDEGFARASRDSDWSESYILDLMAWHLRVQQAQPRLAGTAQWAFKDFGTPLRPENPIPYVNQKGLVDRANRPKSLYYLFQAAQTTTPVCHLEAHDWPLRAGEPTAKQRVRVITNCATVELFVNGRARASSRKAGCVAGTWRCKRALMSCMSWAAAQRAGLSRIMRHKRWSNRVVERRLAGFLQRSRRHGAVSPCGGSGCSWPWPMGCRWLGPSSVSPFG